MRLMKPETLAALQASIEHWERLQAGEFKAGETPSGRSCPLCNMFFDQRDVTVCVGCPVYQKTGFPACRNTPYADAHHAWYFYGAFSAEFKQAAAAEITFLKSLLPTNA